jgi:hypothetical protein
MQFPFVDSASFLSEDSPKASDPAAFRSSWLLALALVMAVASSSAVLLAL